LAGALLWAGPSFSLLHDLFNAILSTQTHRSMHFSLRTPSRFPFFQTLSAALLAATLALAGVGCGGAGANGGDDGDGNGGNGEDTTAPASPSSLKGTSGDSAIDLTWDAVGADDLDGYNVYRATSSIGDLSGLSPQNGSLIADTTGYRDGSVENGTTYHYVVTAVDTAANESGPSGEIEKTPFDDPPSRP
jgi:hypothetical protein